VRGRLHSTKEHALLPLLLLLLVLLLLLLAAAAPLQSALHPNCKCHQSSPQK